jgi:hypothetical protein
MIDSSTSFLRALFMRRRDAFVSKKIIRFQIQMVIFVKGGLSSMDNNLSSLAA